MKQALVASSAKEACAASNAKGVPAASSTMAAFAASDADMVEKNQMGGEKPVMLIRSSMCCIIMIKSQKVVERCVRRPGGQGAIMTMMWNANRVSEAKYKNFVEQCVRHLEKKEMCHVLGEMLENCSCMIICGTGGLVDSASSRRWRGVTTCTRREVNCAELS